jgi:hypothetical protein
MDEVPIDAGLELAAAEFVTVLSAPAPAVGEAEDERLLSPGAEVVAPTEGELSVGAVVAAPPGLVPAPGVASLLAPLAGVASLPALMGPPWAGFDPVGNAGAELISAWSWLCSVARRLLSA